MDTGNMTEPMLREELRSANADLSHMLDLHPHERCEINRIKVRILHLECRLEQLLKRSPPPVEAA